MHICVIGLGYIGLPSATLFAYKEYNVVGIDIDDQKVNRINRCDPVIREPKLREILVEVVKGGRLRATCDYSFTRNSDAVLIAVPTPVKDRVADLSYLASALENIKKYLHKEQIIVIESTVPPGTTCGLAKKLLEKTGLRAEEDFYLAHVPERIAPGKAIEELLNTPRVVGGIGPRSTEKAIELYSKMNPNLYTTDSTTAEFVKLIENAFRNLNIAFANLIALMSEKLGIDAYEAIRLANTHPRVNIHIPGAGVGGPCLTKDPYILTSLFSDFWATEIIRMARRINEYMPNHMIEISEQVLRENGIDLKKAKIAVLGAAYKGGIDDTRESPSKYIVHGLLEKGINVVVYDSYTSETFGARRAESLEEALDNSDAIIIATDHPEFKEFNLNKVSKLVKNKIIVDGRRAIDPYKAYRAGFKYYGIGFGKAFKL